MRQDAYATLEIKSVDRAQRVIEGWASTPTPDGGGDVMEPTGAQFQLPIPLLWHHQDPIGQVEDARIVPGKGIYIKARVSTVHTPGRLKEFVDDAWASFSASPPIVRGLSIGWRPIEKAAIAGTKFTRHLKWRWLELSGVVIPMNAECTVTNLKTFDIGRAAPGTRAAVVTPPGDTGPRRTGSVPMNVSQQLESELLAQRTKAARLQDLFTKDGADGGLDADEASDGTTLTGELETHARRVKELKVLEGAMADQGHTAFPSLVPAPAPATRVQIEVKALPKGTGFTRVAMALAAGRGSFSDAISYARRWDGQTPEVTRYLKAAAGSSVAESPGWGSELVYANNIESEFAELLRPETLLGRIPGWRMSPFNVRIPVQTVGATVNWVGEKAAKPVSELDFTTVTLPYDKVAGIVVITNELARLSSPSAEATVRTDLVNGIAQFLDVQLVTPSVAVSANNPASLTNLVTAIPASGTDLADLFTDVNAALANYDAANIPTNDVVIVTTPTVARGMGALRNSLGIQDGQVTVNPTGGTLMGYPVYVSASVPTGLMIFIKPSEVLLADDGRTTLDVSHQATLDMAGGDTPTFNLWQKNCTGILAERWVTWKKRRSQAVQVISGAAYAPA